MITKEKADAYRKLYTNKKYMNKRNKRREIAKLAKILNTHYNFYELKKC